MCDFRHANKRQGSSSPELRPNLQSKPYKNNESPPKPNSTYHPTISTQQTRILLGTGSQLETPLLKFHISTPFGVPAVPVPNRPYFVGAHYWTVIHREPTLPGGQPGPHRNKQTDNSTSKGQSFNVMKSKQTKVTTMKVTIASVLPWFGADSPGPFQCIGVRGRVSPLVGENSN